MGNQQVISVVILDLSVAFNSADHELFLQVLHKKCGLSGSALEWYSTSLKPRRFRVCIHRCYSSVKPMHVSVPKGSIQGAFLFIAYASTILETIPDSLQLKGYADDHSLRKSFKCYITFFWYKYGLNLVIFNKHLEH